MIRHIVMWKLDESYSTDEKNIFNKTFGEQLLQLEGKIAELKSISVHSNSQNAPTSNYDLLLDTTFNSIEDLNLYSNHPEHIAVAEFAKQYKRIRSCVDFEF